MLPPIYGEGASEIKSYVTTALDEGAEKCIVCELGMKSWKSGLNVQNALGGYMKAVSYQTICFHHKTMTS